MRQIVNLFDLGNVIVVGLRGRGKDMLMSNVAARRNKKYVSNVDYGGDYVPFDPNDFDCGRNTYRNFIEGNLNHYSAPYPDGTDIYISDCGVYFPAQYCNELNKLYPYFPTFFALSRHLMDCNIYCNCQNLNRIWDKLREQADVYILCNWCKVFFGKFVIQRVTIYENAEACQKRVPPFRLRKPLLNPDRLQQWDIQKQNYLISHGVITSRLLIYMHRSDYDTRRFKEMLENA